MKFAAAISTTHLSHALLAYAEKSRLDHAEILNKQGKKLSIELWRQYAKGIPTKQRIHDDATAVFARGGRLKSTKSAAVAVANTPVFTRSGPFKGRINVPASRMKSEIQWRQSHRNITAVSWLHNRWTGREGAARKLIRNNFKSVVLIAAERANNPYVVLENATPGVAAQNARHGYVSAAIAALIADVRVYIVRKENERINLMKKSA